MTFIDQHLLSVLTLLPLCAAAGIALLVQRPEAARGAALVSSALTLALASVVVARFDASAHGLQLVERTPWIASLHVDYAVGIDGLNVLLVLLACLAVPLSQLGAWNIGGRVPLFHALILVLQAAMIGVFTAQSFVHWFVYWELSLVPAFFLMKLWGGPRAQSAAMSFFLYTLVGSVGLLLAFVTLFGATGSFDFQELARMANSGALDSALSAFVGSLGLHVDVMLVEQLLFAMVAFAFFVKAPLWPFHTWLPDAYAEAPPTVTALLTGVLSKMGIYGLLRLALPLFPGAAAALSPVLLGLAVVTVISAALSALAQRNLLRMAAFSSVNHVGYCLLGIFAATAAGDADASARATALDGVVVQMFNHGVSAAAMFFLLGCLVKRAGTAPADGFGGLRRSAPRFYVAFGVVLFGSIGLPGLSGFVGELLIFKGALVSAPLAASVATVALVVTAVFLLGIMQRVWWGEPGPRSASVTDLDSRETVCAAACVVVIVLAGVWPRPFVALGRTATDDLAAVLAAPHADGGAR